ncbi:MAG: N-acetyl-gamma-glutamyl-phosphate reductase [Planctomycetota bacterium]|nr:MAG: N-acetyl-gamma-glutamyl-phosphate reductase [Planctomycetota bacterium]
MSTPVWLFGASGMLGGESLRLLESHPQLRLAAAVSREAGAPLRRLHPHVRAAGTTVSPAEAVDGVQAQLERQEAAVALLALPHGESAALVGQLQAQLGEDFDELLVVDLAADFRLQPAGKDPSFAYGLVEWNRERIARARRVAAPGCFATALQLAVLPAARAGILDAGKPWILHAITGSSGSGATPSAITHHPHRHDNLWAYGLQGHRHEAELARALEGLGQRPPIHFLPHSGPFARGIHLTAALPLAQPLTSAEATRVFAAAYAGAPFVEVLEEGVPDLRRVVGGNRAALAASARGGVLTVLCTLDNLLKGGAGQALQCLNLMLGFPEPSGLPEAGLGVC